MGAESTKDKKRKRYVAHSKSVKKGSYPLRPGVQGFFITCDGGRERQASHEAINVIDTFYEQLVDEEEDLGVKHTVIPKKPMNKVIKFSDSDSSSDDEKSGKPKEADTNHTNQPNESVEATIKEQEVEANGKQDEVDTEAKQVEDVNHEDQENEAETSPKKQRLETDVPECKGVVNDEPEKKAVVHDEPEKKVVVSDEPEKKSIDKQIEDELKELKDRSKRRFVSLDPGCNGVAFVQMLKRDGDPSPAEIVKHMMTTVAATRKHMSRFILRLLPVELTCYASEEEISKAIKPLMDQYFPAEAKTPLKFAVLYEARANTGIDRMSIINTVAKSVPAPHKVDLNNPDKSIVVQIAKTVCSIGVVEKYKELSKYNLRQLTSPVG